MRLEFFLKIVHLICLWEPSIIIIIIIIIIISSSSSITIFIIIIIIIIIIILCVAQLISYSVLSVAAPRRGGMGQKSGILRPNHQILDIFPQNSSFDPQNFTLPAPICPPEKMSGAATACYISSYIEGVTAAQQSHLTYGYQKFW